LTFRKTENDCLVPSGPMIYVLNVSPSSSITYPDVPTHNVRPFGHCDVLGENSTRPLIEI